jgi:beta-N-acetylhexosaminidase
MTFPPRFHAAYRGSVVLMAIVLAACAGPTPTSSPSPTASPFPTAAGQSPTAGVSPSLSTPATAPPPATPTLTVPSASPVEACANQVFASMTDRQRLGQLFMVGLINDELSTALRAAIARDHFGNVSFTATTRVGVTAIRGVTDDVQAQATSNATAGVRFFIAANQEGGLIQALRGPGFDRIPSALEQGTIQPATLQSMAARWGRQLASAGVNFDFAPVSDVVPAGTEDQNAPIGQLEREYGHDPTTVATHVVPFINGMRKAGIATSAKHFPGLGRVEGNTDYTAEVVDSVTTRGDPFIQPFADAVTAHTAFVMVSLATYQKIDPSHLAVFSPTIIDGILRGDLGFRGVVISDSLGATAVKSIPPGTRAIDFVAAGGDMIIINSLSQAETMADALLTRSASDATFHALVDAAVHHVLRVKDAAGLLACD